MLKPKMQGPTDASRARPVVHLGLEVAAQLEELCDKLGYNRSELIRELIKQEHQVQFGESHERT